MRVMVLAILLSVAPAVLAAQDRELVRPDGPMRVPITPAIRSGNMVYSSGQLGFPPGGGGLVAGGIRAETRQTLENLDRLFKAAGTSLARAVKCTVFMADLSEFAAMNEVYATFFPTDPPARTTVGAALVAGARVEIECIAVVT